MKNRAFLFIAILFSFLFSSAQDAFFDAALVQYKNDFAFFRNQITELQNGKIPNPRNIENNRVNPSLIYATIKKLDAKREQNSGLLFYSYQNGSLSIFFCTKDGLQQQIRTAISLDSLYSLEQNLRKSLGVDLLESKSRSARGISVSQTSDAITPKSTEQCIGEISQVLFPPKIVENLEQCAHLYIIPCYNLYTVPFSCLYVSTEKTYLISKFSYVVVPSLYDWVASADMDVYNPMSNQYLSKSYSVAVVGNPTYYKGGDSLDKMFDNLLGAMMQTTVAATLFEEIGGDNLIYLKQNDATKSKVIETITKTRDMIYIATHGVVDMQNPLDGSFLALAPDVQSKTG